MPEKKEFIILILLCIIAFGLGYRVGQPKEATDNAIIPKPEEQVVGTPEWKDGGDTYRGVLLDGGVYEWYKNGKMVGELHFKTEDGEVVKNQQPETPKVNNPNVVKPTSTEIQKSKYKLIAENIELKERMEEINANYKALEQRTKHRMSQLEHHAESNRKQNRNLIDSLTIKREEAERMKKEAEVQKKMYLSRFASLVNVMKENNELREWKKVAEAAGLKLPKGPVTKPDYVRPPKNVRPAPVIIDPNTGVPIPDSSKGEIVPMLEVAGPVNAGRVSRHPKSGLPINRPVPINNPALAESLRQYRKALEAAKNRKAIEASKREKK